MHTARRCNSTKTFSHVASEQQVLQRAQPKAIHISVSSLWALVDIVREVPTKYETSG
eukprot:m.101495 g.101495  ORF g.101495 m.101495 type:complete len:57 (+) comp13200_c0_seq1:480-650(+)